MHSTQTTKIFDVSADRLWQAFDDFGGIHKFHPLVESSPTLGSATRGLGCERVCNLYGGGSLKERVIGYEPGKRMSVEIYDAGPFPLKYAVADIGIEPAGLNRSTAVFAMRFEPKFGMLGWLMAKLVMRRQFKSMLDKLLAGLETYLATGRHIGRNGVPLNEPVPALR